MQIPKNALVVGGRADGVVYPASKDTNLRIDKERWTVRHPEKVPSIAEQERSRPLQKLGPLPDLYQCVTFPLSGVVVAVWVPRDESIDAWPREKFEGIFQRAVKARCWTKEIA